MNNAYSVAKARYAAIGIDTDEVIKKLKDVSVSLHCGQGDDVVGFDFKGALSGGIQTTGNYPGKATTPAELMADIDKVLSLDGGAHKLNLHATPALREHIKRRHSNVGINYNQLLLRPSDKLDQQRLRIPELSLIKDLRQGNILSAHLCMYLFKPLFVFRLILNLPSFVCFNSRG